MSADQQMPSPEELAELVKGLSDEELKESIKGLGVDNVVRNIFEQMPQSFLPEKAAGVNSTLQYNLTTDDGVKTWTLTFADGTCTTSEGAATDPRLTMNLDLVDFVRLIFNQADGTQLFMSGKLKLQGDMMFAMQMQGFFARPA